MPPIRRLFDSQTRLSLPVLKKHARNTAKTESTQRKFHRIIQKHGIALNKNGEVEGRVKATKKGEGEVINSCKQGEEVEEQDISNDVKIEKEEEQAATKA